MLKDSTLITNTCNSSALDLVQKRTLFLSKHNKQVISPWLWVIKQTHSALYWGLGDHDKSCYFATVNYGKYTEDSLEFTFSAWTALWITVHCFDTKCIQWPFMNSFLTTKAQCASFHSYVDRVDLALLYTVNIFVAILHMYVLWIYTCLFCIELLELLILHNQFSKALSF